jgi:hypothetical protein
VESSDVLTDLNVLMEPSIIVRDCFAPQTALDTEGMNAVQFLEHIARDSVHLDLGDWVLVSICGTNMVGRAMEMARVFVPGTSVVRMLVTDAWIVESEEEGLGGMLLVDPQTTTRAGTVVVVLECAAMTALATDISCKYDGSERMRWSYSF